jgi:aspartate racemase
MSVRQHRVIGLVGGMSWQATALYYRYINQFMHDALGGHHNARSVMYTVDFAGLLAAGSAGRWDEVAETLVDATRRLAAAGADLVVLTANSAHIVADRVATEGRLPLLHIADATIQALPNGVHCLGLVGTSVVTGGKFYRDYLRARAGIEVIVPSAAEQEELDHVIFDELTLGRIEPSSRERLLGIVQSLRVSGAAGVILGCTELPLLLADVVPSIACYDTTRLHALAAVRFALQPT